MSCRFDTGLINTILDTAEHLKCGFQILNCRVNRGGHVKDVVPTDKSTALVQFYSNNQVDLVLLEAKIHTLTDVMAKAEATMKVVGSSFRAKGVPNGGNGGETTRKIGRSVVVESQEEQRVLVLGAGRVSMSLVNWLGRTAQKSIHVASDNEEEARMVAKIAKRGSHIALDLNNSANLASLVKDKDVVISLLPAPMHPIVAEECIRQKASLVTASYESPAMKDLNER
jgi:alpha-aminoadipic semialdehyde synthase